MDFIEFVRVEHDKSKQTVENAQLEHNRAVEEKQRIHELVEYLETTKKNTYIKFLEETHEVTIIKEYKVPEEERLLTTYESEVDKLKEEQVTIQNATSDQQNELVRARRLQSIDEDILALQFGFSSVQERLLVTKEKLVEAKYKVDRRSDEINEIDVQLATTIQEKHYQYDFIKETDQRLQEAQATEEKIYMIMQYMCSISNQFEVIRRQLPEENVIHAITLVQSTMCLLSSWTSIGAVSRETSVQEKMAFTILRQYIAREEQKRIDDEQRRTVILTNKQEYMTKDQERVVNTQRSCPTFTKERDRLVHVDTVQTPTDVVHQQSCNRQMKITLLDEIQRQFALVQIIQSKTAHVMEIQRQAAFVSEIQQQVALSVEECRIEEARHTRCPLVERVRRQSAVAVKIARQVSRDVQVQRRAFPVPENEKQVSSSFLSIPISVSDMDVGEARYKKRKRVVIREG
jgi:hypothetical protein